MRTNLVDVSFGHGDGVRERSETEEGEMFEQHGGGRRGGLWLSLDRRIESLRWRLGDL